MQWLQDPNQSNADNLNNVRHEASRHFRERRGKGGYLKAKIDKLPTVLWLDGETISQATECTWEMTLGR